jgi:hypothetical protein
VLATDYQRRLGELIQSVPNEICLPSGYEDFFSQSGPAPSCEGDRRRAIRTRVRTTGILYPRQWLPVFPRTITARPIYTKDFSKSGFGFIARRQYYPGERVRILLATFWMEIAIQRCCRLGPNCFVTGSTLLEQHEPSLDAFLDDGDGASTPPPENDSLQLRERDLSSS